MIYWKQEKVKRKWRFFMAQKNVLRYVILGLLSKQECAG